MQVVYERCCGLDVHKKSITACLIIRKGKVTRTFGTMTGDILDLCEWLKSNGCTHVAMESTGVFWKPVYNILEVEDFQILVVNAQHIKAVPGRKTDCNDAEWIADLFRHGLLKGSYIPKREQRELRELVRYRRSLVAERAREVNRLQKVLEGCNIKLAAVLTDISGVSGRFMIEAIVHGVKSPKVLAQMARGPARRKIDQLEQALHGLVGPHQRMIMEAQLKHIDFLNQQIARLDREVQSRLAPFNEELELLDTIPGVSRRTAEEIVAETGMDMNQFPTAAHLASWAGMCPGLNESAGKRKPVRTRDGNKYLRSTLVEAARAAAHTKNTYLCAQYRRIAARRGPNRAAVAVGHTILVMCYYIIKNRVPYKELGADYFEKRREASIVKTAVKRLESLGYKVTVEHIA